MRLFLFCFAFLISFVAMAQPRAALETSVFMGKMLDIYPGFPQRTWHSGASVSYVRSGNSHAHILYRYPESGFCLSLHEFGNRKVLGRGVGVQYEMVFKQSISERWSLVERLRMGVVAQTGYYHYIKNRENIVNGSSLSFLMSTAVGLQYRMRPQHALQLQATVWHSSNGHTSLPNVGMNSPALVLTYRYDWARTFKPTKDTISVLDILLSQKHRGLSLYAGVGINEAGGTVRPVNGGRYAKYIGAIGYQFRWRAVRKLHVSLEAYYDATNRLWNENMEWVRKNAFIESSVVALYVGHEFVYQRLGLLIQGGVNVYNPTLHHIRSEIERQSISNSIKRYVPGKVAVRYYFRNPWFSEHSPFLQLAIKSHFGQADFLEAGIGYTIGSRND